MPAYLMHIYYMHAVFNKSTLINAFFSRSNKELIKRMLRSLVEKTRIEIVSFFFNKALKKLTHFTVVATPVATRLSVCSALASFKKT